jgi:hypothetical protein
MGTKYINIYTFIDDVVWYEKLLSKQTEKKPLIRPYLVGYLHEVIISHSTIDLYFDKEFEED